MVALVFAFASVFVGPRAEGVAQPPLTGAECAARGVQVAAALGAQVIGEPRVEFLVEKDTRAHQATLPQDGCIGFLAVGHGMVKDLDLALHASTGVMLAQDAAQDAHPYVRYCGAAGLSLHLVVQMYEGRGEVTVVTLLNAPSELPALTEALQGCGMPAPDLSALTDVGPEPPGPSLVETYELVTARLAQSGYLAHQVLVDDSLGERHHISREAALKPGSCYALAAIGDATVEDLDLRVLSTGSEQTVLGEDTSRDRTALIKLCAVSEPITLDIRMYQGHGRYQVHAFVAATPRFSSLPVGVEGASRIGLTEISHSIARRGMQPVATTWALAQPGEQMRLPVPVTAGGCYAFGAIVGPELAGADLDLRVLDAEGRLLAWELGPSDQPLVFHCPTSDQVLQVIGEAHGVRAAGRFLVIVAHDAGPGDKS